jgi:hypothetical protein
LGELHSRFERGDENNKSLQLPAINPIAVSLLTDLSWFMINPLKPNGNYVSHLLEQLFILYLYALYDSEQGLFP